jgi:PBP1b-binding outer membrane lipoprotein LpoB
MKKATILAAVIIAMFVASCGNGTNGGTTPTTDSTAVDSTVVATDSTLVDSVKTDTAIPFHTPIN